MICPRKAEPNRDESNNSHKEHRTRAASCAVVSFAPVEQSRAGDEAKPIGADSQMPRKHEGRSEEHTSELQTLMRISYAVLRLTKKTCASHQTHYAQTKKKN